MMSIESLLNPCQSRLGQTKCKRQSTACSNLFSSQSSSPLLSSYEQQAPLLLPYEKENTPLPKDVTRFAISGTKGEIRYEPCEARDEEVAAQHQLFQIYPMCGIAKYCKTIPYSSEKKGFLEKTGREGFEVFRYIFKVTGDDTEHVVMWDYNVGLVRVTPFFKSLRHNKTSPGQMLKKNPGLGELSHNITGGSIYAQGYWLPFEAAKAVAATFCYNIRYALTPIFGLDFLSMCLVPTDPGFGQMIINPAIVRQCSETVEQYLALYRESPRLGMPKTPPSSSRGLRPRSVRKPDTTGRRDQAIARLHSFTAMNTQISHSRTSSYYSVESQFPTTMKGPSQPTRKAKRVSVTISTRTKDNSEGHHADDETTEAIVQTPPSSSTEELETSPKRRRKSSVSQSEEVAAEMLMRLGRADAARGRGTIGVRG